MECACRQANSALVRRQRPRIEPAHAVGLLCDPHYIVETAKDAYTVAMAVVTNDSVHDYQIVIGVLSASVAIMAITYGVMCSFYNREYLRYALGEVKL